MRYLLITSLIVLTACNSGSPVQTEEIRDSQSKVTTDTFQHQTNVEIDSVAAQEDSVNLPLPMPDVVKSPSGIYRATLPYKDSKVEQTVKFYNNNTYRLQETYIGSADSVTITEGTWAPSNGYVWLYNDQVVRARYKWKGNTLQYFNPGSNKSYSMTRMQDVLNRKVWNDKKNQGIKLFGIGNEPFWSVELSKKDTLEFLLSEWEHPVRMKVSRATMLGDTTVYNGQNDSAHVRLAILPYFCSDGMSDFTYENKILVTYNQQMYHGCGVFYR
jgi:uncharacterized membrane protein